MQAHFVRHYESGVNIRGTSFDRHSLEDRLNMQRQAPLTASGRKRALDDRNLFPHKPDVIYCSEFERARDTARTIYPDRAIIEDERLNERSFGDMTLLSKQQVAERFPGEGNRKAIDPVSWKPPGGESFLDVVKRVEDFHETLRQLAGSVAVCFTHETVIWGVRATQNDPGTADLFSYAKVNQMDLGFTYRIVV